MSVLGKAVMSERVPGDTASVESEHTASEGASEYICICKNIVYIRIKECLVVIMCKNKIRITPVTLLHSLIFGWN